MKFNAIYLSLSSLFLFSILFCVQGNEQQWLDNCRKACDEDFLPKLEFLAVNYHREQRDLDALLPNLSTCQYRCYRCHLKGVTDAWSAIKKAFEKHEHEGWIGRANIESGKRNMVHYLNATCYSPWETAIKNNDDKSLF